VLSDPRMGGPNRASGIAWLSDGRIVCGIDSRSTNLDLWTTRADPITDRQTGTGGRLAGKDFSAVDPTAGADGRRLITNRYHVERSTQVGVSRDVV